MQKLVFVYGTLQSGHGNNRLFGESSKCLGEAVTKTEFLLTNVGFPYMIPERELQNPDLSAPVQGELWLVTEQSVLDDLDRLEGVDFGHYRHETVDVLLKKGGTYTATCYVPCSKQAQLQPVCKIQEGAYVW